MLIHHNNQSQSASLSEDQDPYHHLTPITTLSRNAIPFSWIDFEPREHKVQNAGLQGWCNIFVGDIPVLENEHAGDTVLAVRVVGEAGVWMVERVKRGVYALMRLRGVGEGEVVVAAKASAGSAFPFSFSSGMEQRRGRKDVGEWWEVAKIEDPEPVVLGKRGRSVADVEVVFGHVFEETHARETQDEMLRSDEGSEGPVLLGVGEQSGDVTATAAAGEQDVEVTQSPQELLDGLREQYLQALYVSKVSAHAPLFYKIGRAVLMAGDRLPWLISPKAPWRVVARHSSPRTMSPANRPSWSSSTERLFLRRREWITSIVRLCRLRFRTCC